MYGLESALYISIIILIVGAVLSAFARQRVVKGAEVVGQYR
jgi:hypothetical protein